MVVMFVVGALVSTVQMNVLEAAVGDLDPAFGNGGKVSTAITGNQGSWVYGVAIQPDGRIVAAGSANNSPHGSDFALARYRPDGGLDNSFGSNGKVLTDFNDSGDSANAIAIQSDGKIVAAGKSNFDCAIARYDTDGSLDPSFGSGGKVSTAFSGAQSIQAVALQTDGRILLVGSTSVTGQIVATNFLVVRLNADGSLDSTFGNSGKVATDFFGNYDQANSIAVQPDGRIIVGGIVTNAGPGSLTSALVRYDSDGSLDATFGNGGKVITDFMRSSSVFVGAIGLLGDGRILVGGSYNVSLTLARYNPDGTLDLTCGNGGSGSFSFTGVFAFSDGARMAIQADGKVILSTSAGSQFSDFQAVRFNADGSLDTTFGNGGNVNTDFFGHIDHASAITTYGNEQFIIAGDAVSIDSNGAILDEFALARYQGNGTPASADLSAAMASTLSQDQLGNRYITYTIKTGDGGPNNAYYVTLKDRLPLETAFQSLTIPSGWVVYSQPAVGQWGTVSISRSLFGPQSATIRLVVKVHPSVTHATIKNNATFTSSFTADPNTANNTATTQTNVP
jgi:uncharacterized delta-60 repeat protein